MSLVAGTQSIMLQNFLAFSFLLLLASHFGTAEDYYDDIYEDVYTHTPFDEIEPVDIIYEYNVTAKVKTNCCSLMLSAANNFTMALDDFALRFSNNTSIIEGVFATKSKDSLEKLEVGVGKLKDESDLINQNYEQILKQILQKSKEQEGVLQWFNKANGKLNELELKFNGSNFLVDDLRKIEEAIDALKIQTQAHKKGSTTGEYDYVTAKVKTCCSLMLSAANNFTMALDDFALRFSNNTSIIEGIFHTKSKDSLEKLELGVGELRNESAFINQNYEKIVKQILQKSKEQERVLQWFNAANGKLNELELKFYESNLLVDDLQKIEEAIDALKIPTHKKQSKNPGEYDYAEFVQNDEPTKEDASHPKTEEEFKVISLPKGDYMFSYFPVTWKEANQTCVNLGATLATFEDVDELKDVSSAGLLNDKGKYYWVGLSDIGRSTGDFAWLNGRALPAEDSDFWDKVFFGGQPNNAAEGLETCGALKIDTAKLYDFSCNTTKNLICEK
ncbi:uncharacterized protein LOC132197331 [Neocloeon triangulifer]|uniref:uncharacterized protein LOC132197331 n=1 Tax=Neocloeon triangulifer TaxID=2078957 RepID=UPI00286F9669|nr:uncharacterized protein LOC132197331 [Neocloeon triangulifer]